MPYILIIITIFLNTGCVNPQYTPVQSIVDSSPTPCNLEHVIRKSGAIWFTIENGTIYGYLKGGIKCKLN
ncbi:hypothetical protein UA38_12120 [Photobacterium kishitanii]|uniref:Uncharacterized protein n=1 Tax=Photobacterium kishitanii TaxID=318456 RepID=A0AAX0YRC8_9GAMM|nr:hypothetical protein UA38_12120 [Photobacterium kishitanii]KJG60638.1 hypothetical protein UA42_14925 [Photobacterium kishitanii]KJG64940.1 hypothetical protein UA40_14620 [Photobacterium kishitanii]KJG66182.1 hypothetical protein UA41_21290 [Photobacterium kishitanii]OBU31471.1 hypothetical protein AYY23_19615 [Photobacterium kishitanii]